MNCDNCQAELESYLRDELAGAERQELKQHLASCAACRQEAAGLQAYLQQLSKVDSEVAAPDGFLERVSRRIERRPLDWLFSPASMKLTATAAAVLMVTLLWYSGTGLDELAREQAEMKGSAVVPGHDTGQDYDAPEDVRLRQAAAESSTSVAAGSARTGTASEVAAPSARAKKQEVTDGRKKQRMLKSADKRQLDDVTAMTNADAAEASADFALSSEAGAPAAAAGKDSGVRAELSTMAPVPSAARGQRSVAKAVRRTQVEYLPDNSDSSVFYAAVRRLVGALNGRIVSSRRDQAGKLQHLGLEAPAKKYQDLIAGLEELGDFKGAPPVAGPAERVISFELNLVYPE
jgi:hypothetical protein